MSIFVCYNLSFSNYFHVISDSLGVFNKIPFIGFKNKADKDDHNINDLCGRIKKEVNFQLDESNLKIIKQAIINKKEALKNIPIDKLKAIFIELLHDVDMEKPINNFLLLFNETELLKIAGIERQFAINMIQAQADVKDKALHSVLSTKSKAIWREIFPEIIAFFHHFMKIVITLTGLNQIGEDNDRFRSFNPSIYNAKAKLDTYLAILTYPSLIFGGIYAYTGSAYSAALLSAIISLSTITLVALYIRFWSPAPRHAEGLENLTMRVLRPEEEPTYWRADIFMQIQDAFNEHKGVLLLGEPGSGKSTIARSWAHYLTSDECPQQFVNTQFFKMNLEKSSGTDFATVQQTFQNYRHKTIFFIDELKAIFQDKERDVTRTPHSLLNFQSEFPYVLAATTTKEFARIESELRDHGFMDSFKRRFTIIRIGQPLSNEIETSLYQILQCKAAEILKDNGVIAYIVQKASEFNPKTSQIDAAHSLLYRAIDVIQVAPLQQLKREVSLAKSKMDEIAMHILQDVKIDPELYLKVQEEFKNKEEQLREKQQQLDHIKKIELLWLKNKQQRYEIAKNIMLVAKTGSSSDSWLRLEIMTQLLSESIKQQKNKIGLVPMLNNGLIDQILKDKKSQEILGYFHNFVKTPMK